jgi:DNA-binding NarL/FixJ family response regulator
MIRVSVVHENRLICELEATALRNLPDLELVVCAGTADEALAGLKKYPCDVLLVSATLPKEGAFTLTQSVAKLEGAIKVLITDLMRSKTVILRYIEEGVAGYVHTDESLADLVAKIRSVYHGEFVVSPWIATALIARIGEMRKLVTELNGFKERSPDHLYAELTERECEVLDLIERGYINQAIADALYITLGTVKNHVHNILAKLDVRTRKHAAIIARQALAHPNDPKGEPIRSTSRSSGGEFRSDLINIYPTIAEPTLKQFAPTRFASESR